MQQVQKLSTALEGLIRTIEDSSEPEEVKRPLIEVVADSQAEIEKTKPNSVKLKGLLGGLAITVQTLGSLGAAWEMVKAAASAAGIILP